MQNHPDFNDVSQLPQLDRKLMNKVALVLALAVSACGPGEPEFTEVVAFEDFGVNILVNPELRDVLSGGASEATGEFGGYRYSVKTQARGQVQTVNDLLSHGDSAPEYGVIKSTVCGHASAIITEKLVVIPTSREMVLFGQSSLLKLRVSATRSNTVSESRADRFFSGVTCM
jgi:hypothetical protein